MRPRYNLLYLFSWAAKYACELAIYLYCTRSDNFLNPARKVRPKTSPGTTRTPNTAAAVFGVRVVPGDVFGLTFLAGLRKLSLLVQYRYIASSQAYLAAHEKRYNKLYLGRTRHTAACTPPKSQLSVFSTRHQCSSSLGPPRDTPDFSRVVR